MHIRWSAFAASALITAVVLWVPAYAQTDEDNSFIAGFLADDGWRPIIRQDGDLIGDGGSEAVITAVADGCNPCDRQRVVVFMDDSPVFDGVFRLPVVLLPPGGAGGFKIEQPITNASSERITRWFSFDAETGGFVEAGPPPGTVPASSIPIPAPTLVASVQSVPVYVTHNGQKTETQLRNELAKAGYDGPWDSRSMLAAYESAGQPAPPTAMAAPPTTAPMLVQPTATGVPTSTPLPTPTLGLAAIQPVWQRTSDPSRRHLITDLTVFTRDGRPATLSAGDSVQLGQTVLDSYGKPWVRLCPSSAGGCWVTYYLPVDVVRTLDRGT